MDKSTEKASHAASKPPVVAITKAPPTPAAQLGNRQLLGLLQARLELSHPADPLELEAERVADRIMRMPMVPEADTIDAAAGLGIHRVATAPQQAQDPAVGTDFEQALVQLEGRGNALPREVRSFMEPRFSADFSAVRLHTDAHASSLARAVDAQAFTVGRDIVFGAGRYAPESESGRRLLAHELTHVLQQGAAPATLARKAVIPSAGTRLLQRDEEPAAEAPVTSIDTKLRERVLSGAFAAPGMATYVEVDKQEGKPPRTIKFTDSGLQTVLDYVLQTWVRSVTPTGSGSGSGDSPAKAVDSHPPWVAELQTKLALQQSLTKGLEKRANKANPKGTRQWDEDSEVVQRLLTAYLLEWTRRVTGKEATANVAELYGRVGDSKDNERARLLGGEPGGYNWCGPASERAAALGLMRQNLRFKGANPMLANLKQAPEPRPGASDAEREAHRKTVQKLHGIAFMLEVTQQGSAFLSRWATYKDRQGKSKDRPKAGDKDFRGVGGKPAEILPLEPGDYIYLCAPKSPLSGHVATIIREEWIGPKTIDRDTTPAGTILSKIYYVSGNAGPVAGGAVRVEQVWRELPPKKFAYYTVAGWGNEYDSRKFKVSTLTSQGHQKYVTKMNSLFIGTVMNDKSSPYKNGGAPAFNFFNAHWSDLAAMTPHLGGKVEEYRQLLASYNAEFATKITDAQAFLKEYVDKQTKLGLPYDKRAGSFGQMNTDRAQMPSKLDADSKMTEIFYAWAKQNKFMDGKWPEIAKWFAANKYDGAAIAAQMGEEKATRYRELLAQFHAPAPTATDDKGAAGAPPANAEGDFYEEIEKEMARPVTGNFSPIKEGHIWVTSILRVGNIEPAKIEAEIRAAQAAASQGDVEGMDPAAQAPGADLAQIRKEILDNYGLEAMPKEIDVLWPGAVDYWEGLGIFTVNQPAKK